MEGNWTTYPVPNRNGDLVDVPIRPLSSRSEKAILGALLQIKSRYRVDVFKNVPLDAVLNAAQATAFVQSDSLELEEHAVTTFLDQEKKQPLIILNQSILRPATAEQKRELTQTVLHELMHLFHKGEPRDKSRQSKMEAIHDILCYRALGLPIPADHWAREILGVDFERLTEERKE